MTDQLTPHQRITGEQRDQLAAELVTKYQAGAPIRDLAEEYGRSYGFVHRVLTEAGVELRRRGGARKPRMLTEQQERQYADRLAGHKIRRR